MKFKKSFIISAIVVLIFIFSLTTTQASLKTFAWDSNQETPEGYRAYVTEPSVSWNSTPNWEGPGTQFTIDLPPGYHLIAVTAYEADKESEKSEYLWVRIDDYDNLGWGKSYYILQSDGVQFDIEDPLSQDFAGYEIRYKLTSASEFTIVDIGVDLDYFLNLAPGEYDIKLVPYNTRGDRYEYYFPEHTVSTISILPLEQPAIFVEYVGIGAETRILVAIEAPQDSRINEYEIGITESEEQALATEWIPYLDFGTTDTQNLSFASYPISSISNNWNFIWVRAVNLDTNRISEATVAYVLYGNIIGTYNDSVPWNQAIVDFSDWNALAVTFRWPPTVRPSLSEYAGLDLTAILPFGPFERSDVSGNGDVYYEDMNFVGGKWGKRIIP